MVPTALDMSVLRQIDALVEKHFFQVNCISHDL